MRTVGFWGCAAVVLLTVGTACTKETSIDSAAGPSVVVSPATVASLTISGASSFYQRGQTAQLTAMANLSNGLIENRTSSATWSSSPSGVVQVSSSGSITAQDEGTATITATVGNARGTLNVTVKYGFRSPDPPPGQRLPVPDASNIVRDVANQYPDLFRNSCQDLGGTWEFMDVLVDRLRTIDLRYGYNGRRGDPNFVARDEIAYHYGAGPSENSRDVYVWDVIGGHCGPTPSPGWLDITNLGGIWLTRGRF